jgi:dimethylargininase
MSEYLSVKVDTCVDPKIVHLKSYVTYLGKNTIISTKQYSDSEPFHKFEKIIVRKEEYYVTNTLTIGETVLMAKGFEKIQSIVKEAGFDVISLNISEFQKCEGAITCLSLLF